MTSGSVRGWLERIDEFNPLEIELGLARVERVWRRLGEPAPAARVVTIAGTNGKGTCAHFLERCLRARGRRVGLYTSPHLLRFNERMRIDGQEVGDDELCAAFARVEAARGDETLTYFEYTTLAAFVWFARAGLDVAVLEVGLGGRLDAVNIVSADVAIVTTIDLDHQAFLGATRERIAAEKAGIFRSGKPAVCGDPAPPPVLRERAVAVGARCRFRGQAFHCDGGRKRFATSGETYRFSGLPRPVGAPLAGFVAAIEGLAQLGELPDADTLQDVLQHWELPGRLQRVAGPVPVILDVAHNPQAGRTLARTLRDSPPAGVTRVVLGMLADKAVDDFVACLAGVADEWLLVTLHGPRGQRAGDLALCVGRYAARPTSQWESVAGALAIATSRSSPRDRIVVCGSFQIVGPALAWLGIYSRPA